MAIRRLLQFEALENRTLLSYFGNQLFPADNPWNERIANAPVAANSATLVSSIGSSSHVHADFGSSLYAGSYIGIPINVVSGTQPKVNVIIDAYPSESDLVPVPIPAGAIIEGDPLPPSQNTGDRHLLVYDRDNNIAYELFNAHRPSEESDGQWHADSEAVWNLTADSFRTPGFTSADAAGLPMLPGLVRADEVLDQHYIGHAIRFTVPRSDNAYVFPASHFAGTNDPSLPRMGERFRLRQSFDISGYSAANQVILQAMKDFGIIVADNGSGWYISGEPSSRWDNNDLHQLGQVAGSNFEAVALTPVVSAIDQVSGPTTGGITVTISGLNFSGGAGMTQVLFGGTPATGVRVISDTQIVATAPAHAAGNVDVQVQSPYGTSASVPGDQFVYGTLNQTQRFVAQVYQDLLQRSVDPAGLAIWSNFLSAGNSRAQMVQAIESSLEYRALLVQAAYRQLLHRPADSAGLSNFVAFLAAGGTIEQMDAAITGSLEYYAVRGGSTNDGFLNALYQDALSRTVDSGSRAALDQALNSGMTRGQVASVIWASDEYHADLIQGYYRRFLHRAADSTGLNGFVVFLRQGGRDQDVLAAIVGSAEYLALV
jgi:hypothetical protein